MSSNRRLGRAEGRAGGRGRQLARRIAGRGSEAGAPLSPSSAPERRSEDSLCDLSAAAEFLGAAAGSAVVFPVVFISKGLYVEQESAASLLEAHSGCKRWVSPGREQDSLATFRESSQPPRDALLIAQARPLLCVPPVKPVYHIRARDCGSNRAPGTSSSTFLAISATRVPAPHCRAPGRSWYGPLGKREG